MTDIKRDNYATGQFLTAADFSREQTYHRTLRQVHNSNLHTWGVGQGLGVSKVDDTHVQVSPGAALDAAGRDVVLTAPLTLDLAGQTSATHLYLVIAYQEVLDPADKVQIGGVDAYVATTERPSFAFVDPGLDANGLPKPAPDQSLALALLTLDSGKLSSIDATNRPLAGSVLPPVVTVRDLTVSDRLDAKSNIFFTRPDASASADTNRTGVASLQNSQDGGGALEIFGRTLDDGTSGAGVQRQIRLHDTVEIAGGLKISPQPGAKLTDSQLGNLSVGGGVAVAGALSVASNAFLNGGIIAGHTVAHDLNVVFDTAIGGSCTVGGSLTVQGRALVGAKAGYVMDRFINRLGDALERGDVVVIGPSPPVHAYGEGDQIPVPEVDLTDRPGDTRVCGVVCEVHGESQEGEGPMRIFSDEERAGMDLSKVAPGQFGHMVTLGAYAACKVDADIAPIVAGDLLTTSPTRGHAQKVLDRPGAIGAIVGKALAPLASGKGLIPILVTLQ